MNLRRSLVIGLVAIAVGSASAAVIPIGEFAGDMFEGFEAIGSPGGYPGPLDIFGGQAAMDDDLAHTVMIAYSLYSGISGEYVYPYNGNLMGGLPTGWGFIEFDTPVVDFGGYIGTADNLTGTTFTFKDDTGAVIDAIPVVLPLAEWTWCGWHSDTPIARIEILGNVSPGLGLTFDDLRANVPEPASLSLLLIGVGLVLRRR